MRKRLMVVRRDDERVHMRVFLPTDGTAALQLSNAVDRSVHECSSNTTRGIRVGAPRGDVIDRFNVESSRRTGRTSPASGQAPVVDSRLGTRGINEINEGHYQR